MQWSNSARFCIENEIWARLQTWEEETSSSFSALFPPPLPLTTQTDTQRFKYKQIHKCSSTNTNRYMKVQIQIQTDTQKFFQPGVCRPNELLSTDWSQSRNEANVTIPPLECLADSRNIQNIKIPERPGYINFCRKSPFFRNVRDLSKIALSSQNYFFTLW